MPRRPRQNDPLTIERLKELFSYSPETGLFTRLVTTSNSVKVGGVMQPIANGYVSFTIDGRLYLGHRLAWFYMTGKWPENLLDHKDRDRSNNRWLNLRPATNKQNHENSLEQANNPSGHRGVQWYETRKKWRATIGHYGRKHLGYFDSIGEAVEVRQLAESMLYTHSPEA